MSFSNAVSDFILDKQFIMKNKSKSTPSLSKLGVGGIPMNNCTVVWGLTNLDFTQKAREFVLNDTSNINSFSCDTFMTNVTSKPFNPPIASFTGIYSYSFGLHILGEIVINNNNGPSGRVELVENGVVVAIYADPKYKGYRTHDLTRLEAPGKYNYSANIVRQFSTKQNINLEVRYIDFITNKTRFTYSNPSYTAESGNKILLDTVMLAIEV